MAEEEVVSTLNDLIETCRNGEQGYREAAENVKDTELARLFGDYASQRAQFASELESHVRRFGEEPDDGGTAPGALHRAWMELRSAVQGGDRKAILSEVERGEDVAKEKYEKAVGEPLPADVQGVVARQRREVEEAHDRIRTMRDAVS